MSGVEWEIMITYCKARKYLLEKYPQSKKEARMLSQEWQEEPEEPYQINIEKTQGQFKLSDKLTALINQIPRKDKRIFGSAKEINNFRTNFIRRRHCLARKLGNPRIDQITFHTFRHF
jgi:integrase